MQRLRATPFSWYVLIHYGSAFIFAHYFSGILGYDYFKYPDIIDNIGCSFKSHNGGFSLMLCALDITSINNYVASTSAVLLRILRDYLVYAVLREKIGSHSKTWLILMVLHPYEFTYAAKLTTDLFGCLAVAVVYYFLTKHRSFSKMPPSAFIVLLLSLSLLFTLRNSILPLVVVTLLTLVMNSSRQHIPILAFLSTVAVLFFIWTLSNQTHSYISNVTTSNSDYLLNYGYFAALFVGIQEPIASLGAAVSYTLSHWTLLTGFREMAYTKTLLYFTNNPSPARLLEQLTSVLLVIIHTYGLIKFFQSAMCKDRKMLILLFAIFPAFFIVAHLRYFLPMIPFALVGVALSVREFFEKRENKCHRTRC